MNTPKVLLIDDDDILTKMYQREFDLMGIPCTCLPGGEEALEYLGKGEYPDIILLDISMPGMGGFETLKRLKEDPRTASIPVIVTSNYSKSDDIEWGKKLGAQQFVNKASIVPRELVELVLSVAQEKK